jgi:hypothetical protein
MYSPPKIGGLGGRSSTFARGLVFIAFICHKDGICCIAEKRLRSVLDKDAGVNGQHISVSRQTYGSYHVSGPGRQQMDQTVPQSNWPRIFF